MAARAIPVEKVPLRYNFPPQRLLTGQGVRTISPPRLPLARERLSAGGSGLEKAAQPSAPLGLIEP